MVRPVLIRRFSRKSNNMIFRMAPEMMAGGEATPKVDVFSFGVILWQAMTCREPYDTSPIAKKGADSFIPGILYGVNYHLFLLILFSFCGLISR